MTKFFCFFEGRALLAGILSATKLAIPFFVTLLKGFIEGVIHRPFPGPCLIPGVNEFVVGDEERVIEKSQGSVFSRDIQSSRT